MIAYRLLSSDDFDSLYDCFLTAFSDYAVDMQMSREQFQQRLTRDGVSLQHTAAAFDGERMVGFCLNALGQWQEKQTAYDGGAAVIPDYRGRGVAKEMFAFLMPRLKEAGVSQYLLEVLTSNTPAATLYRKLGFVETRRLAVFRSEPQKRIKGTKESAVSIRPVQPQTGNYFKRSGMVIRPGRIRSKRSKGSVSERTIISAYVNNECVGYGVVFVPSANLMQLAVAPQHRRKGIGSTILAALERSEPLKINNIDEELKPTLAFYEANGYKQVLEQFEMIKTL